MTDAPPHLLKYAKFLRNSNIVGTGEGVIADKRVDHFKGSQAVKALLSREGQKLFKNELKDESDAEKILQEMMDMSLFIRVVNVNNTRYLQPDTSRAWSEDATYAWVYEGSQTMAILMGLGILFLVFSIPLYPLWPYHLRTVTWYLLMLGVVFVAFIGIIAIIRAIVFSVTYFTHKPGIWLFPRLFDETVGVVDSFIPVWEWHKPKSD